MTPLFDVGAAVVIVVIAVAVDVVVAVVFAGSRFLGTCLPSPEPFGLGFGLRLG